MLHASCVLYGASTVHFWFGGAIFNIFESDFTSASGPGANEVIYVRCGSACFVCVQQNCMQNMTAREREIESDHSANARFD